MKFRWLALSGLLAFGASASAGADPASDAARHIKAGDYSAAAEQLRRAAPFAREQVQERFLLATALAGSGERGPAVEMFEALIADYPDYPEPYNNLAALYAAEGELDKAKNVLERAIRTDDRYAVIYGNLSSVYVEMARVSYVKALRLKETPDVPNLRVLHAIAEPAAEANTVTAEARPTGSPQPVESRPAERKPAPAKTKPAPVEAKPAPSPKQAEPSPVEAAPVQEKSESAPVAAIPPQANASTVEPAPTQPRVEAEPASPATAPVPPAQAGSPTTPVAEPKQGVAPSTPEAEVDAMLAAWAKAWSGQDVETYLGFYVPDFTPSRGGSRASWEAERRERLARPGSIDVTLEDVQVRLRSADSATVRVVQRYQSPSYQDRTRKAFSLVRRDGRWLIATERTLQVLP